MEIQKQKPVRSVMPKISSLFEDNNFDDHVDKLKKIFEGFHPLYPNYANFLNKVRDDLGKDFISLYRVNLEKFYFAQTIVSVYQPPPLQDALKRKKGYYPKLISFYPFEKLFSDTGKIIIYPMSLKEARRRDVPVPVVEETGISSDYEKNIKENGEWRFPRELRHVYSSGKFKKGTKPSDKMSMELKRSRAEYILENQPKFTTLLINNAKKLLAVE